MKRLSTLLSLMLLIFTGVMAKSWSVQHQDNTADVAESASIDNSDLDYPEISGDSFYSTALEESDNFTYNGMNVEIYSGSRCGVDLFECTESDITVPSMIEYGGRSYTVTTVFMGEHDLSQLNTTVRSVRLPETVDSIAYSAFYFFTALSDISLPKSLRFVGENAFGLAPITHLSLPQALEVFCPSSIISCTMLQSITIDPENPYYTSIDGVLYDKDVKSIVAYPLAHGRIYEMPASLTESNLEYLSLSEILENIEVPSENITYSSIDGVLFTKDRRELLLYPPNHGSSYTIPEGTETIGERAFYKRDISQLDFPSSLRVISTDAFNSSFTGSTLLFNDGLREIGEGAFYDAPNLNLLIIPSSVSVVGTNAFYYSGYNSYASGQPLSIYFGSSSNMAPHTEICNFAFLSTKAQHVTIGAQVLKIDDSAFSDCSVLSSLIIEDGVQEIADYAFYGNHLTELTIPKSVKNIGWRAFSTWGFFNENYDPESRWLDVTTLSDTPCAIRSDAFNGGRRLSVPFYAINDYQENVWSDMFEEVVGFISDPIGFEQVLNNVDFGSDDLSQFLVHDVTQGAYIPQVVPIDGDRTAMTFDLSTSSPKVLEIIPNHDFVNGSEYIFTSNARIDFDPTCSINYGACNLSDFDEYKSCDVSVVDGILTVTYAGNKGINCLLPVMSTQKDREYEIKIKAKANRMLAMTLALRTEFGNDINQSQEYIDLTEEWAEYTVRLVAPDDNCVLVANYGRNRNYTVEYEYAIVTPVVSNYQIPCYLADTSVANVFDITGDSDAAFDILDRVSGEFMQHTTRSVIDSDDIRNGHLLLEIPATDNPGKIYFENMYLYVNDNVDGMINISRDDNESPLVDVYTTSGILLKKDVPRAEATKELSPGVYVIGHKLILVR